MYQSFLCRIKKDPADAEAQRELSRCAQLQRIELAASFLRKKMETEYAGKIFISSSQEHTADAIVSQFFDEEKRLVTLIAEPQWGKTGTLLSAAFKMCMHEDDMRLVDFNQVFIITGLNDTEWQRQTSERMIAQFSEHVFHRARIHEIVPRLENVMNALLIIDEAHIASKQGQTIKDILDRLGLLDIQELQGRNIRILQTSATPDSVLIDSKSWGKWHGVVKPVVRASSYVSFKDFLTAGRIKDSLNLEDPEEMKKIFDIMHREYQQDARYHIIRLPRKSKNGPRKRIEDNLCDFADKFGVQLKRYSSEHCLSSVDKILQQRPLQHTIILVVDYWRAAKTLNDTFLGVIHERLVKTPSNSTIVQSLAGRCVGHNKNLVTGPIIFTHLKAVQQYVNLCEKEFNYIDVKYVASGIRSNGFGKLKACPSYAYSCRGIDHIRQVSKSLYGWKLFLGPEPKKDAAEFVQKYLKTTLPEKRKNADGFYVQNDRITNPLYVYNEYFKEGVPVNKRIFKGISIQGAKKETTWRQYALYKDPTDITTLVWFVCWRKNAYPGAPSD